MSTVRGWGGVVTGRVLQPLGDSGLFTGHALCVRGACVVALVPLLAAWCAHGGRGGVTIAGYVLCRTSRRGSWLLGSRLRYVRKVDSVCR